MGKRPTGYAFVVRESASSPGVIGTPDGLAGGCRGKTGETGMGTRKGLRIPVGYAYH